MKRGIISSILAIFLVLFSAVAVFAGDWVQENGKYKYDKGNGNFAVDEWENIGGVDYHFDEFGFMNTGITEIGNNWYYFNDDGSPYAQGSQIDIMGTKCNIGEKGKIVKMPKDFSINDWLDYEAEKKASIAGKKEQEKNLKEFQKAIADTPQFSDEQLALQAAKKAAEGNSVNLGATDPTMNLITAEKRTAKYETEDGKKITLTIAIPTFGGPNADAANLLSQRMFNAIGSYLEESLSKLSDEYKFTTIKFAGNTTEYVTIYYKSDTKNICIQADINFKHNGINISSIPSSYLKENYTDFDK